MSDTAFVSADIEKITQFEEKSQEVITEFDAIKAKFDEINSTLLNKWEGVGSAMYKKEADHILENIGGIKDILDGINNSAVKDIKDSYMKLDDELSQFNKNPQSGEVNAAG